MDIKLNLALIEGYKSSSQISRVLTESWVKENSFCPNCSYAYLEKFPNNSPVADFYCGNCNQEFELKSKVNLLPNKIVDGAYHTMIDRIGCDNNPNFFFLAYEKFNWSVRDFFIVPKHFFVPELIEKRKPLSANAIRANWTGCNILLDKIPSTGKIYLVKDSTIINESIVIKKWKETEFLRTLNHKSKGWLIDILCFIDLIPTETFTLKDIYRFETELKIRYPQNKFVKEKIRQQLQILRDRGLIEFTSRGNYKKKNIAQ